MKRLILSTLILMFSLFVTPIFASAEVIDMNGQEAKEVQEGIQLSNEDYSTEDVIKAKSQLNNLNYVNDSTTHEYIDPEKNRI